jgi:hypothetical protein
MFLPVHAARRPPTLFALTVFAFAMPGVAFAIPRVALAIPGVVLAIPGVALAIPGVALAIPGVALAIPGVALAIPGVALAIPEVAFAIPIAIPPRTAVLMPFIAPPPRLFLVRLAVPPVKRFPRPIAFLSKIIVAPKGAPFGLAVKTPPFVLVLASKAALAESFSGPSSASLVCSGTVLASKGPVAPPTRRSVVFVVAAGHEGSFSNRRDH